ncbi:MAG: ATP-binding protein [Acidilobaceae archaeon]
MGDLEMLGFIVESRSPRVSYGVSTVPLPLGEYVSASYTVDDRVRGVTIQRRVLAVVSNAGFVHAIPQSVIKYLNPNQAGQASAPKLSPMTLYVIAEIVEGTRVEPPRYPIPPDTVIDSASGNLLSLVYSAPGGVRLGMLSPSSLGVEIKINPDKLVKHLLIAGATGSGKSNTVAVIADRISAIGAPVVVFDVHGEYDIIPEDGDSSRVVKVQAKINPMRMPPRILALIIIPEPQARRQRRILYKAIKDVKEEVDREAQSKGIKLEQAIESIAEKRGVKIDELEERSLSYDEALAEKYKALLIRKLEGISDAKDKTRVETIIDKVEEFFEITPITMLEDPPLNYLELGKILVVDASTLTDDQRRWMLKIIVDELLLKLKSKSIKPVVLVVEEAPLFLSIELNHPVKQSLQRFAREGRKFGGCLIVVSQRPRSLDVNVVSQLQNFIFLRMVQEEDIRAVMNIADNLDENLARIIPSLPDGRGLVMGEIIGRFPALVDIDLHKGKKAGAAPKLTETWSEYKSKKMPVFDIE